MIKYKVDKISKDKMNSFFNDGIDILNDIPGNKKSIKNFEKLKLTNIVTRYQDGNEGWEEQIPFDIIISTKLSRKNLASFLFSSSFLYDLPGVAVKPIILVLKFEK